MRGVDRGNVEPTRLRLVDLPLARICDDSPAKDSKTCVPRGFSPVERAEGQRIARGSKDVRRDNRAENIARDPGALNPSLPPLQSNIKQADDLSRSVNTCCQYIYLLTSQSLSVPNVVMQHDDIAFGNNSAQLGDVGPEPILISHRRGSKSTIGMPTVEDAIEQYVKEMAADGRAKLYIEHVVTRVRKIAAEKAWLTVTEFTDDGITAFLYGMKDRYGGPANPKTRKLARGELGSFLAWCVRRKKIDRNPIDLVDQPRISKDRKVRAMTTAELQQLLNSVPNRKNGREAADVYMLSFWTGFRRSDLKALRVFNVDLKSDPPQLLLRADQVKERRSVVMPIVAPEVLSMLERRIEGKLKTEKLFRSIPKPPIFDRDLVRAGIPKVDARGQKLVLHSCRHGLATALGDAGVDIRKVQKVMRHADIATTMHYTDVPETARVSALTELQGKIRPFALANPAGNR